MRLPTFLGFVFLCGCQCLTPVDERPDGGSRDAGTALDAGVADAGLDAGVRCVTPSQCAPAPNGLCLSATPVTTCLNGACVWECVAVSRTCFVDAGAGDAPCLNCLNEATRCGSCARARVCVFEVRNSTCSGRFATNERFAVGASSTGCGGPIFPVDGGAPAGHWVDVWNSTSLARIDELGGQCLVSRLPTGLSRALVSCPSCAFISEGCD